MIFNGLSCPPASERSVHISPVQSGSRKRWSVLFGSLRINAAGLIHLPLTKWGDSVPALRLFSAAACDSRPRFPCRGPNLASGVGLSGSDLDLPSPGLLAHVRRNCLNFAGNRVMIAERFRSAWVRCRLRLRIAGQLHLGHPEIEYVDCVSAAFPAVGADKGNSSGSR
jgi:hypothetical protein